MMKAVLLGCFLYDWRNQYETSGRNCKGGHIRIVIEDILLTSFTITQTQFQITQDTVVLEKILTAHTPCQCNRWEIAPTITFGET